MSMAVGGISASKVTAHEASSLQRLAMTLSRAHRERNAESAQSELGQLRFCPWEDETGTRGLHPLGLSRSRIIQVLLAPRSGRSL